MRRKKLLAAISITAVLLAAAGCGKSDEQDQESGDAGKGQEQIELDFFQMKNEAKDVYDKIIARFEEENPGVKINQISPADSEAVFFTNISTGDIPDIMSIYPAEAPYKSIMDEGIMADMTGAEVLDQAEDYAIEMTKHNDRIYAMPYALSSFGIFCNIDIFSEYNLELPETYEDFIAVCEGFKEAGIEAIACNDKDVIALGQEAERIIGIICNDVYNAFEEVGTGNASFTDADLTDVRIMAETMLEMRSYGPADTLAIGREQATADFANGQHPMFISGTWGLAAIVKAAPDMNLTMIPLPNPVAGGEQSIPINIDIAIGYAAETEYPEEALSFIEFCARPEINQMLADEEGTPTVIKGVDYNVEALKTMKDKMAAEKTFLTLVNFWPAGMRNEWAVPMQQLVSDKDIDAFLEATDKIAQQYYSQE